MVTDTTTERMQSLPLERRWRNQKRPTAGVLMLIHREQDESQTKNRRYLLIQRRQAPFAGRWALVGGKIEFGETIARAAIREVLEETGLTSHFVALRAVINERLAPTGKQERGGHWLLFVCEVSALLGEAQEQDEGPLAWFTCAQLESLNRRNKVIPSDFEIIIRFSGAERTVPFVESVIESQAGDEQLVSLSQFEQSSED